MIFSTVLKSSDYSYDCRKSAALCAPNFTFLAG